MNKSISFLILCLIIIPVFAVNRYVVDTFRDQNGKLIAKITVPGIPVNQRVPGPVATPTRSAVLLNGVPAFDWSYGCSATSAAMISGYYDRLNFGHIYSGPANGGLMPLDNSNWGDGECPLSATHQGYDGLLTAGHVDRFWTNSTGSDPWGTSDPTGTYKNCTADYMGTNQDWWGNSDGSTTFYYYTDGSALHDPADGTTGPPYGRDGIHGFKLFLESRGYTVNTNFNQYIYGWDGNTSGYTIENYRASIDAGIPVLIQIEGHTMVGIGYETNSSTIYVHNTWDYDLHSMTWGGVYSGMAHYGVGIISLNQPPSISVSANSLSNNLQLNSEGTGSFVITNNGTGQLNYSLSLNEERNSETGLSNVQMATNPDRSIAGSTLTLNKSLYSPGTTSIWTLTVYNGGSDDEWLKHVLVTFPAGVTVNSATNFIGGGGGDMIPSPSTGTGITIDWLGDSGDWGVVYMGRSATATLDISIDAAFTGNLTLPYEIRGDVYGANPHVITGNIILNQQAPLLPWFNPVPLYNVIAAGQSKTITCHYSSHDLVEGTYTAGLLLNSNDPYEPSKLIDVTLYVSSGNLDTPVITSIERVSGGVQINWNPVTSALHYQIFRSASPHSGFTCVDTITQNHYTDNGSDTKAFYYIRAID